MAGDVAVAIGLVRDALAELHKVQGTPNPLDEVTALKQEVQRLKDDAVKDKALIGDLIQKAAATVGRDDATRDGQDMLDAAKAAGYPVP